MSKQKYNQTKVFEFRPSEDITPGVILELADLIRIGVSGEVLQNASVHLKKHFVEVKSKALEIKEAA